MASTARMIAVAISYAVRVWSSMKKTPAWFLSYIARKSVILGDDDVVALAGVRCDVAAVRDAGISRVDDVFALVALPA